MECKTDLDMNQRMHDMEEKMTSIDIKITETNIKLTQVIDALLGNPLTKYGGFMNELNVLKEKVRTLEQKAQKQELFQKRVSWTVAILTLLVLFIQYLINVYLEMRK